MEFGEEYAEDTIKNAKALAAALDKHGFDVQGKEFGYTQSHQVAVNVKNFQGGEKVSKTLELNDIILNMNMLPHEPLRNHDRPEGIRIGVQEMTRYRLHFRYAHLRLAITILWAQTNPGCFPSQNRFFTYRATAVIAKFCIFTNHSVTWNDERNRIFADSRAHGSSGSRQSDLNRHVFIRNHRTKGYFD